MHARAQELMQLAQDPAEQAAIQELIASETDERNLQLMAAQAQANQQMMLAQAQTDQRMMLAQAQIHMQNVGVQMMHDAGTGSHTTYQWVRR
ncbi:hypothetical protein PsYK624_044100 [Phanerochaete sordida]|uniref:Uncharacterized protein n=1 Tax=Phanerochaete sordida TaxID=48140 RepID=A0A9P3G3C0_9APHY|nr:hypothetical protein PsYK624_044100 [Phanerochaete sordida]